MTLRRLVVSFERDSIEYAVTYEHTDSPPTPGTKKRTTTAARMAAAGLERALEALREPGGPVVWGGFGTNTKVSKDTIIVDRKEHAA
jgi:hypothetical protein